jgi:dTMP kinase
MTGRLITLEGIEGVGKSTNLAFVCEQLENAGLKVVSTREPGGTALAERIRESILTADRDDLPDVAELLLMFAARSVHIAQLITPALESGTWVVCDRFTDASYAYQGGGRGLDRQLIATLEKHVQGDMRPDLTILLDAPISTSEHRRHARNAEADRFEKEEATFFERVREAYLDIAAQEPGRVAVVDASASLAAVQDELRSILDIFISNNK